jgi:hypothetical protein
LSLALNEIAIESSIEDRRGVAGEFFFCFLIARSFRDFSASSLEALLSADVVCSGAIADTREKLSGEVVIAVALRSSVDWGD